MPHLGEMNTDEYLEEMEHFAYTTGGRLKQAWDGFLDFIVRDNILEVAIGLIIAAAFTAIVTSFVSDVLLPILSLLPFLNANFEEKFAVLRGGPGAAEGYNTVKQALADGAVVMAYGTFLNKVFNLLGVGLALYSVGMAYGWMSHDQVIKRQVKCKYCRKWVSDKAKRCFMCTSWFDGREDQAPAS